MWICIQVCGELILCRNKTESSENEDRVGEAGGVELDDDDAPREISVWKGDRTNRE